MVYTLAHNLEALITAFLSVVTLVLLGTPLLYSLLSAFCFVLAGWGKDVSWWRRLVAPGVSAVGCFVLVGIWLVLLFTGTGAQWVNTASWCTFVLFLLLPLPICRLVLAFGWRRALLAALLITLLGGLCVGVCYAGLAALLDAPPPVSDQNSDCVE